MRTIFRKLRRFRSIATRLGRVRGVSVAMLAPALLAAGCGNSDPNVKVEVFATGSAQLPVIQITSLDNGRIDVQEVIINHRDEQPECHYKKGDSPQEGGLKLLYTQDTVLRDRGDIKKYSGLDSLKCGNVKYVTISTDKGSRDFTIN